MLNPATVSMLTNVVHALVDICMLWVMWATLQHMQGATKPEARIRVIWPVGRKAKGKRLP